jgi:uncharacterized membrane protein YphA (DoxX/SURF4 family)
MQRLRHPWVVRAAQILIGLVFIAAALPKIGDPESFASAVHNYRLLPMVLENLVAITLPWIELVAGLALILGLRARAGGLIASLMMVVFTIAVAVSLARGLDVECGCFGTGDASRIGLRKLVENVLLLVLSLLGTLRAR